jgi:sialate O-acetylesterase
MEIIWFSIFQVKSSFVKTLFFLLICHSGIAQLSLPPMFSDHAVLQRDKPVPVWGSAAPNAKVTVTLAGNPFTVKADRNGLWRVSLPSMPAGGPYTLMVASGKQQVSFADIWLGEVWLCSGQSNMEWRLEQAHNYAEEKPNSNLPMIRQFYVDHEVALQPKTVLEKGDWKVCTPETSGGFTAVGYFFAKEIQKELNVAVGLIHSSWGGSQIEGWLSKEAMMWSPELSWYANILPQTWAAADSLQDYKLRMQFFGKDFQPTATTEAAYTQPGYDFSKWQYGDYVIGQWDWKGIWAFRGSGYMARVINVSAEMAKGETILGLGIQDNFNQIYLNGKLLYEGIKKGTRTWTFPPNTFNAGENKLVIRFRPMIDPAWFGPGVTGNPADFYLKGSNQQISLVNEWRMMPGFADAHSYAHSSNNIGTSIYNAMIAPLVPYGMQGILWYQGETNAGRSYQYRHSMPLLIYDWRRQWKDTLRFYQVQLSSFGRNQSSNEGSGWAELREAQFMAGQLHKTGLVVTTDVGNANDIHPTNKLDVGKRLALVALKDTYGKEVVYSGPIFTGVSFQPGKAILSFKHTDGGLMAKGKYPYVIGFEIAGTDKKFTYARAEISGDKIIVYGTGNEVPASVRYAWSDAPVDANLYNGVGLPAFPFRTDDWPGITKNAVYEEVLKKR